MHAFDVATPEDVATPGRRLFFVFDFSFDQLWLQPVLQGQMVKVKFGQPLVGGADFVSLIEAL